MGKKFFILLFFLKKKNKNKSYSSCRNILRLETSNQILLHHHTFKFLENPLYYKKRTTYYSALATLFFADENIQIKFEKFMEPFSIIFKSLIPLSREELSSEQCKVKKHFFLKKRINPIFFFSL